MRDTRSVPDFRGLSLRGALRMAGGRELNVQVQGNGYVVDQRPAAGQPLDGTPIRLTLSAAAQTAEAPLAMQPLRPRRRGGA